MKNTKIMIVTLSTLGMVMASALVKSECRTGMDAEMLAECITIEGSGANYQDWRVQYKQATGGSEKEPAQQGRKRPNDGVMVSERRSLQ